MQLRSISCVMAVFLRRRIYGTTANADYLRRGSGKVGSFRLTTGTSGITYAATVSFLVASCRRSFFAACLFSILLFLRAFVFGFHRFNFFITSCFVMIGRF